MLFNSFQFAVFLPIVFILYWTLPHKFRWMTLLASSYYFYMSWNVEYVTLILFTTGVSYFSAIALEKADSQKKKQMILRLSLLVCLGALFIFKYFNFFFNSISEICRLFSLRLPSVSLNLLLPVGISFYTFQTLSYVIDVYRGKIRAERNFGIYATFVSFFPQLVAGPIERTEHLLPQIKAQHFFQYDKAICGMELMAWGYFKKIVVADNLAVYVDKVYENPPEYAGFAMFLSTLLFTLQIYCDFSGYSDIACGTAKLLDIDLTQNFKTPYFSQSVKEFWERWHISLSAWFRDYVYIPLGGNRASSFRHCLNLLTTFLVSGLWHGANWTFLAWGGVHGLMRLAESVCGTPQTRLLRNLRRVLTFCFVALAWVFFRAQSIPEALYVFGHMFDGISNPIFYVKQGLHTIGFSVRHLAYFVPLIASDYWAYKRNGNAAAISEKWNPVLRGFFYFILGLVIVFLSKKGEAAEFVYFQF